MAVAEGGRDHDADLRCALHGPSHSASSLGQLSNLHGGSTPPRERLDRLCRMLLRAWRAACARAQHVGDSLGVDVLVEQSYEQVVDAADRLCFELAHAFGRASADREE